MAPDSKILLIRHGEATHNLRDDFSQHDPGLTKVGKEQCQKLLRDAFDDEWPDVEDLDLVVMSPLRRTMETGLLVFDDKILHHGLSYIVLPEVQETSDRPCDTGRPTAELKLMFPGIEFTECDRTDWLKKHHGFYSRSHLHTRAAFVRKWLYERPEKVIAIVTHSGFLRWLAEEDFPFVEPRDSYRNCEYRGYTFVPNNMDNGIGSPYKLQEEKWSVDLRKVKRSVGVDVLKTPGGEAVPASANNNPSEGFGGDGVDDDNDDPTDAPTIIF